MNGADILGIVALAVGGGAGAYVVWYVTRFGAGVFAGWSSLLGKGTAPPAEASPGQDHPGELPMAHDPLLTARIEALREEVAAIAAMQARMMEEQSEREGMLLAEMRAVASVMDPNIVESLARIETSVGSTQPPPSGPEPGDGPDPASDTDHLHVVPDERGSVPESDGPMPRTIRRG